MERDLNRLRCLTKSTNSINVDAAVDKQGADNNPSSTSPLTLVDIVNDDGNLYEAIVKQSSTLRSSCGRALLCKDKIARSRSNQDMNGGAERDHATDHPDAGRQPALAHTHTGGSPAARTTRSPRRTSLPAPARCTARAGSLRPPLPHDSTPNCRRRFPGPPPSRPKRPAADSDGGMAQTTRVTSRKTASVPKGEMCGVQSRRAGTVTVDKMATVALRLCACGSGLSMMPVVMRFHRRVADLGAAVDRAAFAVSFFPLRTMHDAACMLAALMAQTVDGVVDVEVGQMAARSQNTFVKSVCAVSLPLFVSDGLIVKFAERSNRGVMCKSFMKRQRLGYTR